MGVSSAVVYIFNETAMHAKAQASNRMAKANRASHGQRVSPRTQAKVRVRKTRDKSKGKSKGTKSANQGAKGLQRQNIENGSPRSRKLEIGNKFRNSGICIRLFH